MGNNFITGFLSSMAAAIAVWFVAKMAWPYFIDRLLYRGIRIDGVCAINEVREGEEREVGSVTFKQMGNRLTGTSRRTQTRDRRKSDRPFRYKGRIAGEQVTLLFEDRRGRDFDTGSYVFRVHNNCVEMRGKATFHGKPENEIVAELRILRKSASPVPND